MILRFIGKASIVSTLCSRSVCPSRILFSISSIHAAGLQTARFGAYGLLLLWAASALEGHAYAQYIPPANGPVCDTDVPGNNCNSRGSSSSSRDSEEDRRARQAAAEARAERKAQRDAENKKKADDKRAADLRARQEAEERRQEAARREEAAAEAHRRWAAQAEEEKALARKLAQEQADFNNAKPAAVSGLKGVNGASASGGGGLGLKGLDDAGRADSQAGWVGTITDPQLAPIARRLASVVPPMPIPEKDLPTVDQFYMNEDRVLKASDYVVAGFQMAGYMGKVSSFEVEAFMIAGKTLIAGQNGAYLYLGKRDAQFAAAAAYLKDPATEQTFAHLVDDVRQNRPIAASADPAMVEAARALNVHHAGSDTEGRKANVPIMWDMMTSREALKAMLFRATVEVSGSILSHGMEPGIDKLLEDPERKAMYDSLRLERTALRKRMEDPNIDNDLRGQITTLIKESDKRSADCYKVEKARERVANTAIGLKIPDALERVAKVLLPETKTLEFQQPQQGDTGKP
jgi:hypothetical protein